MHHQQHSRRVNRSRMPTAAFLNDSDDNDDENGRMMITKIQDAHDDGDDDDAPCKTEFHKQAIRTSHQLSESGPGALPFIFLAMTRKFSTVKCIAFSIESVAGSTQELLHGQVPTGAFPGAVQSLAPVTTHAALRAGVVRPTDSGTKRAMSQ